MAKLPDPTLSMNPETRELYDRLVARRGRIDGMYRSLLNHPELTRRVSELGSYLRFGSGALPDALRELVILWLARRMEAAYEWVKHEPVAREAGVPAEIIEAIRSRQDPSSLDAIQRTAIAVAQCVFEERSIPLPIQEKLTAELGMQGVIELVVLCGFYRMIAGVIFAFDVPLPEGSEDPFRV